MARFSNFAPSGVIPATLLAFHEDMSIDEAESRRHLRFVANTRGISAITVNGHASEIHACNFDEQRQILRASLDEVGDELPLINGVYADGSIEAARIAKMAAEEGASGLLVLPPQSMIAGGRMRPEMAIEHFRRIADATDLPIIAFQYSVASGLGYPLDTLLDMIDSVPTIRAIKDWSADPFLHEQHIRVLQSLPEPVTVLTTHSGWLMASLSMGAGGLLSGAGSVVADLQVALFEAIRNNDLATAKSVNDRLYPVQQAFYAQPFLDMHNRMKECLVLLGRMERAVVRPPLMKLTETEIAGLREALDAAGLTTEGAFAQAAE